MVRWPAKLGAAAILAHAPPSLATYSIVGADAATGEVGGTGTSCLGGSDVYIIYGAAPGFGVIHAQAQANQNGRDRGVELLEQSTSPADVIAAITSPDFDGNAAVRQYGVADATGRTAGFTGDRTRAYAGDRQGTAGTFSYSVQGNILTSEAVLTQAEAAFVASGCDLAERLMRALEAGALNGEGDNRCTPDGIPADSSFVQVERPDAPRGSYLELHVRTSGSGDPIVPLREQFDAWRTTHPCPAPPGGGAGGGAGMSGAGVSGGGLAGATAGGGSPEASGSTGGGGSPGASGSTGGGGSPDDSSGCACRTAGSVSNPAGMAVALAALALLRRRARA